MRLKTIGVVEIPKAAGSAFDHGAFDPKTLRVFIAHTARDCVDVIDDAQRHIATLPGFPGVAGAVADNGGVLVTNRGAASLAWLDAATLETKAVFKTGARPNGAAIVGHAQWKLPSVGAHGLDIDHNRGRLYAACDDRALVEIDSASGEVTNVWPIAGAPDVTFFNPATGLVHIAIGEPGLVETVDPRTGRAVRTMTAIGAHTTVLVPPDRLYVISPAHGGILVLVDT
jgi:DNA-binding beta-propeller fold protein YncE